MPITVRDVFITTGVAAARFLLWLTFSNSDYAAYLRERTTVGPPDPPNANKEKISYGRLEVHEIAVFVLNASGYYEAINRNSPHYYLSDESLALFTEHMPSRSSYIVGQVVHIERQTVKLPPSTPERVESIRDRVDILTPETGIFRSTLNSGSASNPYGLPLGCEYFIVTVAMLSDTAIHLPQLPPS